MTSFGASGATGRYWVDYNYQTSTGRVFEIRRHFKMGDDRLGPGEPDWEQLQTAMRCNYGYMIGPDGELFEIHEVTPTADGPYDWTAERPWWRRWVDRLLRRS